MVAFLLTGEYNIRTQPEYLDFSTSIITFSKAVEAMLYHRLFIRFRDEFGCTDAECSNEYLRKFMRKEIKLTLGNFSIILGSSSEAALRAFTQRIYPRAAETFFGPNGVVAGLNDPKSTELRNRAAHDETFSKEEAGYMRTWALGILQYL